MSSSTSSQIEPARLLHYARQLNNSAAMCIEVGKHKRAISSLQKGLKLLMMNHNHHRNQNDDSSSTERSPCCDCYRDQCTLDACIAFSESESKAHMFDCNNIVSTSDTVGATSTTTTTTTNAAKNSSNGYKKRKVEPSNADSRKKRKIDCTSSGYVYRLPIRVPPQQNLLDEQSNGMKSSTLILIIIAFNLAIAHHLQAIAMGCASANNKDHISATTRREAVIENTLCLYEHALKLLRSSRLAIKSSTNNSNNNNNNNSDDNNDCSIRFHMILQNNMSQLYHLSDNPTKHRQSLQKLLSYVMIVVEHETRDNNHSSNDAITATAAASTASSKNIYLDGFIQNTMTLILQERCAEAA